MENQRSSKTTTVRCFDCGQYIEIDKFGMPERKLKQRMRLCTRTIAQISITYSCDRDGNPDPQDDTIKHERDEFNSH